MQSVLSATTLAIGGYVLWHRRLGWRHHWRHVLTLSLTLQAVAFVLCAPQTNPYIGKMLYAVSHIAHLDDFLGHICFIAAASAGIYAAAYRLMTEDELEVVMCRVDKPAITASLTMLVCITFSHSTRVRAHPDFFDVPVDGWLRIYWLTYMVIVIYLLIYMMRLFLVLRTDARSRVSSDLILAGAATGAVAVAVIGLAITIPIPGALHALHVWIWALVATPSAFAFGAGLWRWRAKISASPPRWLLRRRGDSN
jgi:hypothetical protein